MQEILASNSLANIHFPRRINLIKNLRLVSFFINDIVMVVSSMILFIWVTNFTVLKVFLFEKLYIVPETSVLFILTGASLFFGAKRHLNSQDDPKMEKSSWWNTFPPIFFASVSALMGLSLFTKVGYVGLHMSPIEGLCFFLLGLSLVPPFTRIPHRFHVTQLLIFIVGGLSMFVVLEDIYKIFFGITVQQNTLPPLSLALTFAFFCFGILLRWSNRGFFGNFTLDSTGSIFALRIFLINLILTPLVAFLVLVISHRNADILYQAISLIVIFFTFSSSLLIWLNLKFLYRYELEHLLMRESLRTHNVDLTADKEKLEEKMLLIEQEKQQFKDELNVESGWRNAIEDSE